MLHEGRRCEISRLELFITAVDTSWPRNVRRDDLRMRENTLVGDHNFHLTFLNHSHWNDARRGLVILNFRQTTSPKKIKAILGPSHDIFPGGLSPSKQATASHNFVSSQPHSISGLARPEIHFRIWIWWTLKMLSNFGKWFFPEPPLSADFEGAIPPRVSESAGDELFFSTKTCALERWNRGAMERWNGSRLTWSSFFPPKFRSQVRLLLKGVWSLDRLFVYFSVGLTVFVCFLYLWILVIWWWAFRPMIQTVAFRDVFPYLLIS